jgi:siroheme synthase (precorrin-2 oxidase/ferrochelatase)
MLNNDRSAFEFANRNKVVIVIGGFEVSIKRIDSMLSVGLLICVWHNELDQQGVNKLI